METLVSMFSKVAFPTQVTSSFVTVMSLVSLLSSVTGLIEGSGKNFQYSKFGNFSADKSISKQIKIPTRNGMLIAYTPSFLSAIALFGLFPNVGLRLLLLKSALAVHFFKRILEVLLVHRYGGGMALDAVIAISLAYFINSSMTVYAQSLTQGMPEPKADLKYIGIVLFLVGIVGNFYHHNLLASLRTKSDKGYKIPEGGLFGLVTCPHYLFEIFIFLGIAFICQTFYAFAWTVSTTSYLMGRSYATRRWYLSKFDGFPKDVKAIIPYVF